MILIWIFCVLVVGFCLLYVFGTLILSLIVGVQLIFESIRKVKNRFGENIEFR